MARSSQVHSRRTWVRVASTLLGATLCFSTVSLPARADHHEAAEALSAAKKMEIFQALNDAKARANRDAEKQSAANPESMNQVELSDKLSKEYRAWKTYIICTHGA